MNSNDSSLFNSPYNVRELFCKEKNIQNGCLAKMEQDHILFNEQENQKEIDFCNLDFERISGNQHRYPQFHSLFLTNYQANNSNNENLSQNEFQNCQERNEHRPVLFSAEQRWPQFNDSHINYPDQKKEEELLQNKSSYQSVQQQHLISPNKIIKNETKNIPKNYGKAIITFIEKQRQILQPIIQGFSLTYQELIEQLNTIKKNINTIANLRQLWVDFKYSKCFRIISNQFLRKHALHYIFNSRISNYGSHVKYRKRLQQAIETPESFKHIKQY